MKKILATFIGASLILSACSGGPRDEKQAFIDATIEATCMIFDADNIFDPALEQQAIEIYKNHGFDAEDDAAMDALTQKYADDEEVQSAIGEGIEGCSADFKEALSETGDLEVSDEDAVVTEDAE